MADLGVAGRLDVLEEARARLEAALADDENWRALAHSDGAGAEVDHSADRRARDMRLRLALEENPLYRAWQHVVDAIDAVCESGLVLGAAMAAEDPAADLPSAPVPPSPPATVSEPETEAESDRALEIETARAEPEVPKPPVPSAADAPPPPVEPTAGPEPDGSAADPAADQPEALTEIEAPTPPPEVVVAGVLVAEPVTPEALLPEPPAPAETSELPAEIAMLIRREADEGAAEAAVVRVITQAETVPAATEQAAVPAEPEPTPANAKTAEARLAIPSVEPVLPAHLDAARRMDRLEAELREMTERRAEADDQGEFGAEPEDAPEAPPAPVAKAPGKRKPVVPVPASTPAPPREEASVTFVSRETKRPLLSSVDLPRTPLFERLRTARSQPDEDAAEPRFVPAESKPEEAEVTIVTQPPPPPAATADPPTAPIRRFLKALSGK